MYWSSMSGEGFSVSVGDEGAAECWPGVDGSLCMVARSVAMSMVKSGSMASIAMMSSGVPGLVFMFATSGSKLVMSVRVSIAR